MFKHLIKSSYSKPKTVMAVVLVLVVAALLQFPNIKIDTDPENMLSEKEFVRIFHKDIKKEFSIYDYVVVGIVNDENSNGVFNVATLNRIHKISSAIEKIDGVISSELISPTTKDNIRQGGIGTIIFEWLMKNPISERSEALKIRDAVLDNPVFKGTMVSEDGKALCIYVPIEKKSLSYSVSKQIETIVGEENSQDKYYITGLPVAEDTFGVEMFKQMAVSAPLAALIICILMFMFFKSLSLVLSSMLVAIVTVILSMGLLIVLGFPVHIMSSMIPIFLMPIAVLDSVHILSEFFDRYRSKGNKRESILSVMNELFTPMLYTSLTSAVGFFSLSFSRIPPVQSFGVFVAIGIMLAWLLTMTVIPAYISLLNEKSMSKIGIQKQIDDNGTTLLNKILSYLKIFTRKKYKQILLFSSAVFIISMYGITKISVNDNPVKWFNKNHKIRIADRVLNEHFGGTYTAYLVMESLNKEDAVFAEPLMLKYIEGLQNYLLQESYVGKTTSIVDVTKKVYKELLGGDEEYNIVPPSKRAVYQSLISYENSHKPEDLWHLTTPDYMKANIWVQLKSGDNKDMAKVHEAVSQYISAHKAPYAIKYDWAGLTYINMVWQKKMVVGMLKNFMGSFLIVFFMMTFLFKSPLRGVISMIPLSLTIAFIYSLLGYFGKEYDMPVAVLSALTLGLSIDFAIHFIERAREIYAKTDSIEETYDEMFSGPARAIVRNSLVIAIGFLPLLFAPLMPYRTVGFFMFAIMLVSSIATLLILPAAISLVPALIEEKKQKKNICVCLNCTVAVVLLSTTMTYIFLIDKYYLLVKILILLLISIISFLLCKKISQSGLCVNRGGVK